MNIISNKALILTDYLNLFPLINEILTGINIDQYSENASLSSLVGLKERFNTDGNLSFLKRDILSFIQQNGYPFITITDMNITIGIDDQHDKSKVIKTLLLSYIIIMQGEQFKNISCNIIILMNNKEYSEFKYKHKHPQNILGILKTNDDRLNSIINEYTVNNEKFKNNFNILLTDAEQDQSLIKSELVLFMNMIRAKENLKNKLLKEKPVKSIGPKITAAQSADVVLRSGDKIFKNGEPPVDYDEKLNLAEGEIYITGNFTSYTRLDVIENVLRLIKTRYGNELVIKKGGNLTLNIPEQSIIDTTTPITLAQLISKDLMEYGNIRIKTTPEHFQLMQQSQGFSMIKKNVTIYES